MSRHVPKFEKAEVIVRCLCNVCEVWMGKIVTALTIGWTTVPRPYPMRGRRPVVVVSDRRSAWSAHTRLKNRFVY